MDSNRFDALAKSLIAAPSRRRTLGGLLGGTLGLLGLAGPDEAWSAKSGKCKQECDRLCEFCKEGTCRTKKKQNGKKVKVCKKGKCKPKKNGTACLDDTGTCQNGRCVCPSGTEECGGACVPLCGGVDNVRNPQTCTCCRSSGRLCANTGAEPVADPACCSGTCDPAGGTVGACATGANGTPCAIGANCDSGNCENGECAA